MFKKIFLYWFAISISLYVLLGSWLDLRSYINVINANLPDWKNIFSELYNSVNNLTESFNFSNYDSILDAILGLGNFFRNITNTIYSLFKLPFKLVYYLLRTIYALVPINPTVFA